jgi:uncharacterized protein DUF5682
VTVGAADVPPRIVFFPVRHHSPACALALLRAFAEIEPRQVLVEAPEDFEPLLPALTDPATRPPVAIVTLPPAGGGKDAYTATYPFCAHSPELVALAWAREHGARTALIDLPSRHPRMHRRGANDAASPAPLIAEWRLDHNAYVAALCARRGVADALALWDALFESRAGTPDWRGFFDGVGLYCRHTREVTTRREMETDGTLAREAHMAARLAAALEQGSWPVAVVTGGFHTPALRDAIAKPAPALAAETAEPANPYLIRYGFQQLDRLAGYGAGPPHPAYYDRLWRALRNPGGRTDDLALGLVVEFAESLRRTRPQLALSTPAVSAAALAAQRLAGIRDLSSPGRTEIIDAIRSTGVKEAVELGRSPLLDALHEFLTGDAIGELPPGVAQPPIVEHVRSQARALGFNLEDGASRTRDLDILRKPRHAAASRFLFGLDLVGAGFASRIAGPDPVTGWRGEALFESWTYAWSPLVESQLIGRAADGQTLEVIVLSELDRRRARLVEEGRSRSAGAGAELLVAAVRTGFDRAIDRAAAWCAEAMAEDVEAASIIVALSITSGLARPGPGAPDLAPRFADLRRSGFERLLMLFPDIVATTEDRLPALIKAIAELGAMVVGGDAAIDRASLAQVLGDALATPLPPALDGALTAFAGLIGSLSEAEVAARLSTMLNGTYVEAGAAAAVLTGCLAVSPRLIVHSASILAAADAFFGRIDQDDFLASLPEIRLAFSQLTPSEIDRIAAWAADRHGIEARHLLDGEIAAHEVAENLALSQRLAAVWREDGLAGWLETGR